MKSKKRKTGKFKQKDVNGEFSLQTICINVIEEAQKFAVEITLLAKTYAMEC